MLSGGSMEYQNWRINIIYFDQKIEISKTTIKLWLKNLVILKMQIEGVKQ